ncbi:hypothetical protein MUP65_01570 [Patescibacteria group bacterium]|nr:hypothetical protein [Patescibacteria group bacterium]
MKTNKFIIDTGPNVHLLCQEKDWRRVYPRLAKFKNVRLVIINRNCREAWASEKNLF